MILERRSRKLLTFYKRMVLYVDIYTQKDDKFVFVLKLSTHSYLLSCGATIEKPLTHDQTRFALKVESHSVMIKQGLH
jgi:hypothetical protein